VHLLRFGQRPWYPDAEALLTLPAFEQRFRTWLLEDFHRRRHSETEDQPKERWEKGGFVPRMPQSLESLDLLLLTVAKTRKVQQDGIHFQNHRYMDSTLASFVKEDVVIRYDPADLGEVHVFYQDRFLCRAVCAEPSDRKVTLLKRDRKGKIGALQAGSRWALYARGAGQSIC
jgi:putative transposase